MKVAVLQPHYLPYYKDEWVTIYNSSSDIWESDVIVLDPPNPLVNIDKFKATTYYIFCGRLQEFYEKQFPGWRTNTVVWSSSVPNESKRVYTDAVLVVGNVLVPGSGHYNIKLKVDRHNKWERPVELLLNLLGSSHGDILDPFMGSGSTLVASKMMGRKCVGFEIDEGLCKVAAERCKEI